VNSSAAVASRPKLRESFSDYENISESCINLAGWGNSFTLGTKRVGRYQNEMKNRFEKKTFKI
jgi:hypothetical protein